jgi:hypothetical protein
MLEAALKLGVCAALSEWALSMALSRTLGAESNMVQRVASQRSRDPMANALYTALVCIAGVSLATAGLKVVRMGTNSGGGGY